MKKTILVFISFLMTLNILGQENIEASPEKNVFKINTMSLLLGTGSIFYEREFTDVLSGQMGVGYMNMNLFETRFSGLILTPELRIHPRGDAIDGFYIGPYFRFQNYGLKNENDDFKGSLNVFGGGLLLGRQWITESGFTMDLFFGGHYGTSEVSVQSGSFLEDYDHFGGFRMRVGFALGFAF